MQQLPTASRKLFLLAAWYSLITPCILFGALLLKLLAGLFYTTSDDGTKWIDWPVESEFYLIIECVFFSSLISGVVSLFGIRKCGERMISTKAIIGILLSLGVGLVAKLGQWLSHMPNS